MLYNSTVSQIAQYKTIQYTVVQYITLLQQFCIHRIKYGWQHYTTVLFLRITKMIACIQYWKYAIELTGVACSQCRHARGLRWLWMCFSRAILYGTVYITTVQYMCIFCLQQKTLHLEYEYNTLQYSTLRCLAIKKWWFSIVWPSKIDLVISNQQRYFEPRIIFFEARCLVKITERFTPESTSHLMPCGWPAGSMSWNHHLKMA